MSNQPSKDINNMYHALSQRGCAKQWYRYRWMGMQLTIR